MAFSPNIIYGTAWKKERTASLVVAAVLHGFRAIDTACQPEHYREDLVGEALHTLQEKHGIRREDLFLQTKFTSIGGQDRNQPLPYDPSLSVEEQVKSSVQRSLSNLRTTYLDSLLLHSPLNTPERTLSAWRVLISLQDAGKVNMIGVSNTYDVAVLRSLEKDGGRKAQIVQNRWYEGNHWDKDMVTYCREQGIQYQSFWTLSGSPSLLESAEIRAICDAVGCTPAQSVYRIAQQCGVTPLSGTTNTQHMDDDVSVERINLGPQAGAEVDAAVQAITRLLLG